MDQLISRIDGITIKNEKPKIQMPVNCPPVQAQTPPIAFSCKICRAMGAVGRYLGDGRWNVTCSRCQESFVFKQD